MTRLLVSVRTFDEALLAATVGVNLIDIKEPARGPLGMADVEVRREIGQRLGAGHQLSAACGELRDLAPGLASNFVARRVSEGDKFANSTFDSADHLAWAGYHFAKIGLAGCAEDSRWRDKWLAWRSMLPTGIEPVLVCYADGERCGAPCYDDLRAFAVEAKIHMILFDTWDKHGPGLCQLWQAADFLRIGQELQEAGISFVLAGKLDLADVACLSRCGASYLGIRGAVCDPLKIGEDARCGKLNIEKTKIWLQSLSAATHDTMRTP